MAEQAAQGWKVSAYLLYSKKQNLELNQRAMAREQLLSPGARKL
jgi:hypothetical protein